MKIKSKFRVGQVVYLKVFKPSFVKITAVWPWTPEKCKEFGYTFETMYAPLEDRCHEKYLRLLTERERGK